MPEFPQYSEDGEEVLFFPNSWRNIDPQEVMGVDCFTPSANVNNGLNRFVMDITGIDFRKMLSALYVGAEIAYPQEFMQIVLNFLKMVHCPIDFEEECQTYPTYTPIIQYAPMSPFVNPDETPEGYLVPPFVFVSEDNIAEYGDYEIGDVIVPIDAITLDLDWFETLDGQLPTITINVEGEGKISLKLLTVPFGGVAIITLDNPPDLLDILAGIITGSDNILDVNRDIVSVPPETTEHVSYEIEVTGMGMHTVYIVFMPVLDDSLIPVRFGGGLRSIELCEFGEFTMGYVEDVRFNLDTLELEQRKNGVYEDVLGFDWLINLVDSHSTDIGNLYSANAIQNANIESNEEYIDFVYNDLLEAQDDIEALQANALSQGTSIENLSIDMEAAEDAIDALDARLDALESLDFWTHTWDFTTDDFGIIPTNATYTAATGFVHAFSGSSDVLLQNIQTGANANQIYAMEVGYSFQSGNTGAPTNAPEARLNGISPYSKIRFTGSGNTGEGLIKAPNNPSANYELGVQDFGDYTITYIKFFGIGDNPF